MKFPLYILALTAPLLVIAAPTPLGAKLTKDSPAESAFWQTDIGWFDDGSKKRAAVESSAKKRDASESAFWQTDIGWFDDGSKKRAAVENRK
jgi:hypothetical protein